WLSYLSADSAFKRFLALKPCAVIWWCFLALKPCPATLQKLLYSFCAAYALKIQRKIFAAPRSPTARSPTASAAALKLKIAHPAGAKQKILELSFTPLLRVLEFPI
ncbi:MAG: hypothetical protein MR582_04120, partial [Campylobacter sp.]|nr:hypothetical protein [Campylobacter sp.]